MPGEKMPTSATFKTRERIWKGHFEMPFIVWTSGMSVDVKLLDNDHKKLAILINDLHDGVMAGSAREQLERIFDELIAYSRIHFDHEELLLDEAGYSGAAAHKQEHGHKIERILEMKARFRSGTTLADDLKLMDELKDWLVSHAQTSDQEFVAHLKATDVDSILAELDKPEGAAE
jgi:hemerythrin